MAERIRRNSMENLRLYDLDKITPNYQLPPPLPPPRHHRPHIPLNHAFERYKFLCDMNRLQTDPIYAATPMFKTIPVSKHVKHRRQLLGTRIPATIVTPVSTPSTKSDEPESAKTDHDNAEEEHEEQEESSDEDDNEGSDDDNGSDGTVGDDINDSSSSSSSDDDNFGDDDDDDDDRGVVEQIFNRGKK